MKKKLNIPKDFWKDFKDRKDFDEFFGELFQEGVNQMLKNLDTLDCYRNPIDTLDVSGTSLKYNETSSFIPL